MSSVTELGRAAYAALAVFVLAVPACSSSDDGTGAMDASVTGAGGSLGTGGSPGTGGSIGIGGSPGTGGSGATGSGGSAAGTGGAPGSGGSGAAGSGGSAGSGNGGAAGSRAMDGGRGGAAGSGGSRPSDASVVDARALFDAPPNCFAGDPTQAMELRIGYRGTAGFTQLAAAPASIGLTQAPQGGQVLFVGVEVRNIAGCTATISTALVDAQTQAVVSLESRPISLDLASDGWLAPLQPTAMNNYSNLPACPRANLSRSIDANT